MGFLMKEKTRSCAWMSSSGEVSVLGSSTSTTIYVFMHDSVQQKYPVLAELFAPATYSFLLLLATLLLAKRGHGRLALTALPLWGIFLSLLFSAGIFVRYAYPIMSGAPVLLALALFRREDA